MELAQDVRGPLEALATTGDVSPQPVHENILEASWHALAEGITVGLLRSFS